MNRLQLQTASQHLVFAGNMSVTLQSQALVVHLPFGWFVLNRPVAVVVARGEVLERIPIVDVTRRVQIAGLVITLLTIAISLAKSLNRKEVLP